jgi:hypothetical protein
MPPYEENHDDVMVDVLLYYDMFCHGPPDWLASYQQGRKVLIETKAIIENPPNRRSLDLHSTRSIHSEIARTNTSRDSATGTASLYSFTIAPF